jgi:hypothetical protein
MTIRHLGRFKMTDSRITTTDVLYPPSGARTTTTRTRDVAEKMELARFPGHHVIAEREGDDLVVYQKSSRSSENLRRGIRQPPQNSRATGRSAHGRSSAG